MAAQGEDVYATLLLGNSYLPGALVLAHSLRDAGTRKKLAVLVTTDSVSADIITELRNIYDYVIPVERVINPSPANLYLMDRPDLQSAFTKITLWKQLQFRRIVYMDADMVALRAPDELFDIPEPFSAAPDIGWPDLFNTGLMVLTPNMGDYYALLAMAQRGISFDGADQGLLNMHFKNNYNRISFTYNVTPSAHYQYLPAYKHFQSSISAAHFIGKEKPWTQGRDASKGSGPRDELSGRWWATYDKHYRESPAIDSGQGSSSVVQHYVKGEHHHSSFDFSSSQQYQPAVVSGQGSSSAVQHYVKGEHDHPSFDYSSSQQYQPAVVSGEGSSSVVQRYVEGEHHHPSFDYSSSQQYQPAVGSGQTSSSVVQHYVEGEHHHPSFDYASSQQYQPAVVSGQTSSSVVQHYVEGEHRLPSSDYSSSQQYHPADTYREMPSTETSATAPEAPMHETSDILEKVTEETPVDITEEKVEEKVKEREFIPPYTAWNPAREPPPQDSKPEASNFPATHYEMSSDRTPFKAPERYPEPPKGMYYEVPKTPTYQKPAPIFPWEKDAPKPTRVFDDDPDYNRPKSSGSTIADENDEPSTPTTRVASVTPADLWQSFNLRGNVWDDIPEIERYIGALQRNRKGNIQVLQGYGSGIPQTSSLGGRRPSMKLTDFPTELERPSLPVTPAPVRRPSFWGRERDAEGELPAAEGVPAQEEWDPAIRLDILARRQSEVLTNKLGKDESGREIPTRPLPYGSEGVRSPTYHPPVPPRKTGTAARDTKIEEPSYTGPSAMWEKGETFPATETPQGASEEEKDALEN